MAQPQPLRYVPAPLFGGAMTVDMPEGFKDMSDFRPIPDHQEVFASFSSDTSIIVEIVEQLDGPSADLGTTTGVPPGLSDDAKAVLGHIYDICQAHDDRYELVDAPEPHSLGAISDPAFTCKVRVLSPETVANPNAAAGANEPATITAEKVTMCYFFMVRLARHSTDILVHVNVPQTAGATAVSDQDNQAREISAQLMSSLRIVDEGLFSG